MKVKFRNILFASAALLAAAGCSKTTQVNPSSTEIMLTATEAGAGASKALLNKETFNADNNRIRIYDILQDGTVHINDRIGRDLSGSALAESTQGVWPFEAEEPYQWTPDTHKFFGWLEEDANSEKDEVLTPDLIWPSGFSFDRENQVLTIPQTAMNESTPQFDFLYSNIVTRDMVNNPDYSAVNLEFQHLFTAVSFGADNSTNSDIVIHEFRVENILNNRAASISFAGSEPVVTYTDATSEQYLTRSSGEFALNSGDAVLDVFNIPEEDEEDERSYMMLWPLAPTYLYSSEAVEDKNQDGEITFSDYPADYKMYINYTVDGGNYEKRMNFPNAPWEAGKQYHYDILFADKAVELTVKVNPWKYEHQDVDYTDATLTVPGVLTWDNTVSEINETAKTISIVNAQAAKGAFTISAPMGGTWMISLVGDVNAFEVTPDTGEIDGNTAHITVKPSISDPKRDYKVKLKFAVRRADGRVITADEVQSTVYTIVLPQNN